MEGGDLYDQAIVILFMSRPDPSRDWLFKLPRKNRVLARTTPHHEEEGDCDVVIWFILFSYRHNNYLCAARAIRQLGDALDRPQRLLDPQFGLVWTAGLFFLLKQTGILDLVLYPLDHLYLLFL